MISSPDLIKSEEDRLRDEYGITYSSYDLRIIPIDLLSYSEVDPKELLFVQDYADGNPLPPLAVIPNGNRYLIIDGHKRFGSALMAGVSSLGCMVLFGVKYPKVESMNMFESRMGHEFNFTKRDKPGYYISRIWHPQRDTTDGIKVDTPFNSVDAAEAALKQRYKPHERKGADIVYWDGSKIAEVHAIKGESMSIESRVNSLLGSPPVIESDEMSEDEYEKRYGDTHKKMDKDAKDHGSHDSYSLPYGRGFSFKKKEDADKFHKQFGHKDHDSEGVHQSHDKSYNVEVVHSSFH